MAPAWVVFQARTLLVCLGKGCHIVAFSAFWANDRDITSSPFLNVLYFQLVFFAAILYADVLSLLAKSDYVQENAGESSLSSKTTQA